MIRKKMTDAELKKELRRLTRHRHCMMCGGVLHSSYDSCKVCKECIQDQVSQL